MAVRLPRSRTHHGCVRPKFRDNARGIRDFQRGLRSQLMLASEPSSHGLQQRAMVIGISPRVNEPAPIQLSTGVLIRCRQGGLDRKEHPAADIYRRKGQNCLREPRLSESGKILSGSYPEVRSPTLPYTTDPKKQEAWGHTVTRHQ